MCARAHVSVFYQKAESTDAAKQSQTGGLKGRERQTGCHRQTGMCIKRHYKVVRLADIHVYTPDGTCRWTNLGGHNRWTNLGGQIGEKLWSCETNEYLDS